MKRILLLGIFILDAMLFACAPKVVPVEKPSPVTAPSEIAETSPLSEWDKVLAAARKEGKVVLLVSGDASAPAVREALAGAFKNRTGLVIEFIAGRGGEISAKLLAERRAGLHLVDVYSGGSTTSVTTLKPEGVLSPLKPLLFLPEVLDAKAWFQKRLPWIDKEEKFIFGFLAYPAGAAELAFNSKLVKREEISAYSYLLAPKFKVKMSMQDPTSSGKGLKWFQAALHVYELDLDFMRALARQEPFITKDTRLQIQWIAQGKQLVSLLPAKAMIDEFRSAGAPIDYLSPKEVKPRIATGGGSLAVIRDAPHPNATKLFANWLLSREGQIIYTKAMLAQQSARTDVPTDFIDPDAVRQPGVEYFWETEEFLMGADKAAQISREIFGHLLR